MLVSGAEVHRVEDSLDRILHAMGACRVDVFIITSSMVVTVHTENGDTLTQTRRIKDTGIDYDRLHKLNALSRKICSERLNAEEIEDALGRIAEARQYPRWLIVVCYSLIAGAFTLFFGGNLIEASVSLFVGLVVSFVVFACDMTVKNKIFTKFMSSLVATALAIAAFFIGIIPDIDKVIIGNIMTLVPGIGLTNAIRDLFVGDSIAGILRTIEACLIALAITAGYFVSIFFLGGAMI
jgi:uncharacterized membrane protein YjjP (DUF1212 family)